MIWDAVKLSVSERKDCSAALCALVYSTKKRIPSVSAASVRKLQNWSTRDKLFPQSIFRKAVMEGETRQVSLRTEDGRRFA